MMVLRESAGSGGARPNCNWRARPLFLGLKLGDFVPGQLRQLAAGGFGFQQPGMFRQIVHHFEIAPARRVQLLEPGVFPRKLLQFGRVARQLRVAQSGFDLAVTAREFLNVGAQVHFGVSSGQKSNPPVKGAAFHGRVGWKGSYFFFFLPAAAAAWAACVLTMRCWNLSTRPAVSTNFWVPV